MDRKLLAILSFVLSATLCLQGGVALADVPDGYYSAADGQKTTALKTALMNSISSHKTFGYSALWNYYPYTYYVIGNSSQVLDMYSDNVYYFADHSNMNKEHVVPKSWWGGSTESGPGCDLLNVIPSDATANSAKSNYPVGPVGSSVSFDNGVSKVGYCSLSAYSGLVFEPADEYKGDFARIYFYVATCYPDLSWDSNSALAMTNKSELTLKDWIIETLLEWNAADPVDAREIQRNEDIYTYQLNRNPFIDYPTLADYIWGAQSGEVYYFSEHEVNEGSAAGEAATIAPTFSMEYGTADSPRRVANGTSLTVTGGTTLSTLYTRVDGGDWTETSYTTGYNTSTGTYYNTAASVSFTISGETCIEAYCTLDGYLPSDTIAAYFIGVDVDNEYLLYEAFDELSSGNNTSNTGSSTVWSGNDNFPTVSSVYCAGNALRMGTSKAVGSITSRELETTGGTLYVEVDVKGWTSVEGTLSVSLTGADAQTISYSATMSDEMEHYKLTFENVSAMPTLTISTSTKRAFVDNIIVYGTTETTTIAASTIPVAPAQKVVYNLAGQHVATSLSLLLRSGLYIVDGKKVIIK